MAVPKKRRSKQKTRHRRTSWSNKAFQSGRQALSASVVMARQKPNDKPFSGFGKSETQVPVSTET